MSGLDFREPKQRQAVVDWGRFTNLADRGEPDYLLDTEAINKRLRERANNPQRWLTGAFHVPDGGSVNAFQKMVEEKCGLFVRAMELKGWTLKSRLEVTGPFIARDMGGVLLGVKEYRVRGAFATVPKPVRIELPPGAVKQAPDHRITLKEAMKV